MTPPKNEMPEDVRRKVEQEEFLVARFDKSMSKKDAFFKGAEFCYPLAEIEGIRKAAKLLNTTKYIRIKEHYQVVQRPGNWLLSHLGIEDDK